MVSCRGVHVVLQLLSFFITLPLEAFSDLDRCPQISVGIMMTFGEKCYRFVPRDRTWNDAQLDCQSRGGNLVHIENQTAQDFLVDTVTNKLGWSVRGMWIGAIDRTGSNMYEWVNGDREKKGEPMTWSNWAAGQPSCGTLCIELCGQMRFDDEGKWHDYQCASNLFKYHYCCVYDMVPTTKSAIKQTTEMMKSTSASTTTTAATTKIPSTLETKPKTTKSKTSEFPTTESSEIRKSNSSLVTLGHASNPDLKNGGNVITVSVSELAGGLVGAIVLLLLLIFLLAFIYRRQRRLAQKENPMSEKPHTPDVCYDEIGRSGRPCAVPHVNPIFVANGMVIDGERPPAVMHEQKEREQNELKGACEKSARLWSVSTNPYEEIEFDKECGFEKPPTAPSNEYLHATFSPRQVQGVDHGLRETRDAYSLDSLCTGRPRHPQSTFPQPAIGVLCQHLDGYILPTHKTGQDPSGAYVNNPGSEIPGEYQKTIDGNGCFSQPDRVDVKEQTYGNVNPRVNEYSEIHSPSPPRSSSSPYREIPSSLSERRDTPSVASWANYQWTPSHLDALSTDRHNHENVYMPVLETSV